ncbi:GL20315 [Drosophila persimilis]|uniref:GL20315 n=1 Tax=Drosophila persimilis TaxID=7234 RepID=B4H646_DROPE|nr:GL20315 [Drosophila persimilis]
MAEAGGVAGAAVGLLWDVEVEDAVEELFGPLGVLLLPLSIWGGILVSCSSLSCECALYGEPGSDASSLEPVLESAQLSEVATPLEKNAKRDHTIRDPFGDEDGDGCGCGCGYDYLRELEIYTNGNTFLGCLIRCLALDLYLDEDLNQD